MSGCRLGSADLNSGNVIRDSYTLRTVGKDDVSTPNLREEGRPRNA